MANLWRNKPRGAEPYKGQTCISSKVGEGRGDWGGTRRGEKVEGRRETEREIDRQIEEIVPRRMFSWPYC